MVEAVAEQIVIHDTYDQATLARRGDQICNNVKIRGTPLPIETSELEKITERLNMIADQQEAT